MWGVFTWSTGTGSLLKSSPLALVQVRISNLAKPFPSGCLFHCAKGRRPWKGGPFFPFYPACDVQVVPRAHAEGRGSEASALRKAARQPDSPPPHFFRCLKSSTLIFPALPLHPNRLLSRFKRYSYNPGWGCRWARADAVTTKLLVRKSRFYSPFLR